MGHALILACSVLILAGHTGVAIRASKVPLTAARLVKAFLTNEAYADEHYVGKEVEVVGKVTRVSQSKYPPAEPGRVEYVVELDLEDANKGVMVDLDLLLFFDAKDRAQLAQLKVGQSVVIRGQCGRRYVWAGDEKKRERDYSQVHFRGCRLVGDH